MAYDNSSGFYGPLVGLWAHWEPGHVIVMKRPITNNHHLAYTDDCSRFMHTHMRMHRACCGVGGRAGGVVWCGGWGGDAAVLVARRSRAAR